MSLWQRLQKWLGRQVLPLDPTLLEQLHNLAEQEQRPYETVAADLISLGLEIRGNQQDTLRRWQTLSAREQQVAALICLGYTNSQIGVRLKVSTPTIKTHARNALRKFGVARRGDLQRMLAHWDFRDWENP